MQKRQQLEEKRERLTPAQRAQLEARLKRSAQEPAAPSQPAVAPAINPDPARRYEPFPLTDLQQAYWVGRSSGLELGNVACHVYHESEATQLDLERLRRAWQLLIVRHDMLRMVVLSDGRQQVLEQVPPYVIEVEDLRGLGPQAVEARLEATRQRMSHQVLPPERWPLFELRASLLDKGRTRLHVSLDTLIGDAWGFRILFRELARLYEDPQATLPPLELTFRDYVLAEHAQRESEAYQRDLAYWRARLPELPPAPELPMARAASSLDKPHFVRRKARLEPQAWERFRAGAQRAGVTPTGALVAAYAEVLGRWSRSQHFLINVPHFNRLPLHPQVEALLGEFASFTLLEVDRRRREPFRARALRLQQQLWRDLDHGRVSGVRLLRELARLRGEGPRAAMPVVFTSIVSLDGASEPPRMPTELGEIVYSITQTPQVWLDLQVFGEEGGLTCQWDAVEELFPKGMMEDMSSAFFRLLEELSLREEAWEASTFDLLPPEWQSKARLSEAPLPTARLQELVEAQVALRPRQPAVECPRRSLTYGELGRLSRRIGHWLRREQAQPDTLVAVVMEKGWEQVVAVLGILQAGAAYLPIDPAVPPRRLQELLAQGQVKLALTQPWLETQLAWPEGVRRLSVDEAHLEGLSEEPLEPVQSLDSLAYVLFTSGSTGVPKGAMIEQRGVVNAVSATLSRFQISPGDRVLGLTTLHHDMSVFDLFGTLAAGGTLVLPEHSGLRDPVHWVELMRRHQVTVWNSVPALMEMLLEYTESQPSVRLPTLRLAFLGGDWIPLSVPRRLQALAPSAQVVSVGGPTETTLWNIWYPVSAVDPEWKSIPYGEPIPNVRYHILNEALEDCPPGVPGQLWCSGVGLTRGYWQDPERTQERFQVHPDTGVRMYRTGDMGRFMPDGQIEFLGREDLQLKVLGYRIEPGEIEAALAQHPGVRAAVVVARGEPQGKKRLVAYVVPAAEQRPEEAELRGFLQERLPAHMVPGQLYFLESLPLNSNGKVDRKALPEPDAAPASPAVPQPGPQQPSLLARLTRLVQEVLGVAHVEPEANLLWLGANSLDLVRLANRIDKELGFRPVTAELFKEPTLLALARAGERHLGSQSQPEQQLHPLLSQYKVLMDPEERAAFRRQQLGLRHVEPERTTVELPAPAVDEALRARYAARRTQRRFSLKPIPLTAWGHMLACLRQIELEGQHRYLYASGGGLYPLQVYLHVKPGRVEGLQAGTYYYHPAQHRLVLLTAGAELDRSLHVPFINQPVYDEAGFSLFFVSELEAIGPMYGQRSLHISTLEAGLMSQLLDLTAPGLGIGLCHIGELEFEPLRPLFALKPSQVLIHSMVGGRVDEAAASAGAPGGDAEKAARLLERLKQLSPEEVRAMLEAQRQGEKT